MSIDFDDRIQVKLPRPKGWTVGRVLNDMAIIMIVVPIGVALIASRDRLPTAPSCGNTTENYCFAAGLTFFAVKFAWKILKRLNDAAERSLARIDEAARLRYLAEHTASIRKPPPLDDF
jgi:hypothetical protein